MSTTTAADKLDDLHERKQSVKIEIITPDGYGNDLMPPPSS
jgi:hypothetical protein